MQRFAVEFCPVDDEGALTRQARSIEDLEGLVEWFLNPSPQAQAIRKRAYERAGAGVASPAAKGEVFAMCAGEFLHRHLLEINAKADEDNRLDDPKAGSDRPNAQEIGRARKTLQGLLIAFKEELFGQAMAGAQMNPSEVGDLIEQLRRDQHAFRSMAASAFERDAQAAIGRLDEYWTLPESRDQMLKSEATQHGGWGIYAPLLKNFSEKATPSQVAEFMTRFDLYIRSGWHQKDLEDAVGEPQGASGLGPMLREIALAREGGAPHNAWSAAFEALNRRFSELFLPLRVTADGPNFRESARAKMLQAPPVGAGGLAGSGMVDAAVASPDGSKLFVAFATSDRFIQSQNNQWLRHAHGVINSLREDPQQWVERGVSPQAQVSFGVFAPASLSGEEGKSIQAMFSKKLSDKAREGMESFAFLAALADGQATLEELSWFDPKIAGCAPRAWQEAREQACEIGGKHGRALMGARFVEHLGELCEEFKRCGLKGEINIGQQKAKRGGNWLLTSMMACITRATTYAKEDETGLVRQLVMSKRKAFDSFLGNLTAQDGMEKEELLVLGAQKKWADFFKEPKSKNKNSASPKKGA